jgi:NADH-quinone oxidoreductase subunit J
MPALLPDGSVSELSVNRHIARYDVERGHLPDDPKLAEALKHAVEEEPVTERSHRHEQASSQETDSQAEVTK